MSDSDWVYQVGPYFREDDARLGAALAAGDFDGDGRPELVMSFPGGDVGPVEQAGGLRVEEFHTPGSSDIRGLYEDSRGIPGTAEAYDNFGESFAVGDFDGDGYVDLAIGTPRENIESPSLVLDAGSVTVLYGTSSGLTYLGAQVFNENRLSGAQANARFGKTLAAGDFDGDGYADLAIGVPERDVVWAGTLRVDAGHVAVLYGSVGGLSTVGYLRILDDVVEAGERFGAAVAAADFDYSLLCLGWISCHADLAIGVPGQRDLGWSESGKVVVVEGSASGLDTVHRRHLYQDLLGDGGSFPEPYDHFGAVLVAGTFRSGSGADLAIGVPDEDLDGESGTDQGMVHLVFGGSDGLKSRPGQALFQRPGLASHPWTDFDHFGAALAIGNLDGGGSRDLMIGIPGRNLPGAVDAGVVQVMYGEP
jgi:hypothetical protein